jgi:SEC-C motif-containing protein
VKPCACGLPASYDACCGRFHGGAAPATAELLMRSRYTAYAMRERLYLLRTWHPTTRPRAIDLDDIRWIGLEVLETTGGGLLETEGSVRFRARHLDGVLEEYSRFLRDSGRWSYVGPI